MPQRARAAKTSALSLISPSKSKKKSVSIRRTTPSVVQKKTPVKKSSPTKNHLEQTSSTIITQPRQKRLSSLTAATLLQYCTSILSPSRKLKSNSISSKNKKLKQSPINNKNNQSTSSRKRQISNVSSKSEIKPTQIELNIPTRTHREASSRASAMIMQQNEIERSRYNYSRTNEHSTSVIRRHRTKSTVTNKDNIPSEPFKFNIPPLPPPPPPVPSVTNVSNQTEYAQSSNAITTKSIHPLPSTTISTNSKYPSLTEAILAEHDRLYETIPSKHDNLLKWTQELALHGHLSSPYSEDELPSESIHSDSSTTIKNKSTTVVSHSNTKETTASSTINSKIFDSNSHEHSSITNNITTPTFLFPSAAYPLDLRSFYPFLSCWQYPTWPFQSSTSLLNQIQSSSLHHRTLTYPQIKIKNSKKQSIISPIHKQKQEILSLSKKEPLTFHLHTHHHHHIHNSNSLLKSLNPIKTTTVLLSPTKSSILVNNKEQFVETKTILPIIENNALNLSINNKKTTRRKSSPVKRHITKSNSSSIPSINDKISHTINSIITSSRKITDNNQISSRRVPKHRSVSAATANSITIVKNSRGKRTNSASNIPIRSNRKRSYSPNSITLPLSNKNSNQKKKQKISNYWILFGKSEQKLVSIHADKPPVFRECYSSIQHITEKDVIKSNDCVILRPETGTHKGTTPYLAKVKWFWEEPTTGEIQMSLIWYYHPEHTELPGRIKERFLSNELLASKYCDCINVACIEDKCYVLNLNEYNRYCLREKSANLFEHPEPVGQLKLLLNKNTSSVHHRSLPAKTVGNQNIFFCRYVYDYRMKRILNNPNSNPIITTISASTSSSM